MEVEVTALEISKIERDMLLQPRATLHQDWIEDYAADMIAGAVLPPIVVFFDGEKYWLGDGFHRTYAASAAGLSTIPADVRDGSRRDALLFSVSANASHGHRRTNDDKRRAVDIMLADPEWVRWSDGKIAGQCGVSAEMVRLRRPILQPLEDASPRLVTRGGTTYEMALPQREGPPPSPDASPAEEEPATFDFEAASLRNKALDAIRTLAALPPAAEVIDAWMKSASYGEPLDILDAARAWLGEFDKLYRINEPIRWAGVISRREAVLHAAE